MPPLKGMNKGEHILLVLARNDLSKPEGRIGVVLKPDFVHGFPATGAPVEAIGEITDQAGVTAFILIAVHHPGRHDDDPGAGLAQEEFLPDPVGGTAGPIIPQDHAEGPRSGKAEEIGLIAMGMGSPAQPRFGYRDICHGREMLRGQLILPENFGQPAALIGELGQGSAQDPGDFDLRIRFWVIHQMHL